ncbi:hypothetical protein Gasu2_62270 [Galdieria sulphuraria]|uniref:Uncharacterized protein n=1 Tax=Galdieria sulphuraria TaxID=130081 RepID=M2XXB0_GALSU|nr:uncharacterized protein Gasu_44160 [Galdieria sulphuraria]EME28079.1 hypothetical protein Gasu_44160 [Galdieria sulphuraria]GJD12115.1 hypothetical protein Gasu2_62270 [Galdieria sulphuraria]|eukprot:XP_005704599.1 hypothetical protein Gasu_44160 [Galdieria sulphuraria]
MFRCCFSIFYSQSRKENIILDQRGQLNSNSDTFNQSSSHDRTRFQTTAPYFPDTLEERKLGNVHTSDSDESVHIVQSYISKDGSLTATVKPYKLSSQDLELCASYLSHLNATPKSFQDDKSEEESCEEYGPGLDALRRICSEPTGKGTTDDSFLIRYRKWSERRSLRLVNHQENEHNEEEEEAALRRMKGSVLRAHSSMTFHF